MGLGHTTGKSFSFAFNGVRTALKKEPNLRIHFFFAVAALILAILLKFSIEEWLLLTFTIFFVIILELVNTALESIVNLVSPQIREEARIAKDVSSAAVLAGAFLAVIVGLGLFLPKILRLILPN